MTRIKASFRVVSWIVLVFHQSASFAPAMIYDLLFTIMQVESGLTLLFLLPMIRPFLPLMAFAADPFHKLFDRTRQKEQAQENGEEEAAEDSGDDIQALIDVGEAEGIIAEEEGELIHSIIEFGDTRV